MSIQTINPATGKVEKAFEEMPLNIVEENIVKADAAQKKWKNTSFKERKALLKNAAGLLRLNKHEYGKILTLEMGKPVAQAIAEVEKCALVCDYYADNGEEFLSAEAVETDASESYVRFDPLGVILAVMPWNFPFWQVFRFAAPALMAGNVCLLKHSSNVPICALLIEEIFLKAGFPENTFITLLVGSGAVEKIAAHPLVKAATLTGSEAAGKSLASLCGGMLKKTVMELGGSDPFIVLADADIDEAVKTGVISRINNNGQTCIAAKRFIAVKEVYAEFEKKFTDAMKKIKTGDPMEEGIELGPMAREDLLIELDGQIKKSISMGASLLCGGRRIESPGYFYEPTLVGDVLKGMPAYEEELFGPAAALIKAEDETDAIRIANDTSFGLGASLWTGSKEKAEELIPLIEAGSVFVNGMVKSDPRLPFGGIKLSGYGRELSHYGIKEFVNIKSVWIK